MTIKIIDIISVSKTYRFAGSIVSALDSVCLSVEEGDVYAVIGLSGAGKSTLIRCIAGLLPVSSGEILFKGIPLNQMNKSQLKNYRSQIGMVFQHFNLFSSRTVGENVAYPLEIAHVPSQIREERVDALLQLVGLSSKKQAYPASLSGGEKQRVGIARALANYPKLLLCDEATSALDPKTTREIVKLLDSIHKQLGITIFLITHEMQVVRQICNKVAVIEKGRIVENGLVSEIFENPQHSLTKQLSSSLFSEEGVSDAF